MTPPIPGSARAVLESDRLAHLVTVGPDGTPQVSCVWVGIEDDEIVFASLGPRRKLDNIARDPRVALSIETDETGQLGLRTTSSSTAPHGSPRAAGPSCCSAWRTSTSART